MRTVKLVIIGDSGVGKTSLRSNYILGRFSTGYRATIGTDFITKTIPHHSIPDEFVTLQIWDTAGQERFSSLSTAFFRGADAVLMVYDVNQRQTLQSLKKWWHEFQERAPVPDEEAMDYCCVVVGNKVDLAEDIGNGQRRMSVSEQEARIFFEELFAGLTAGQSSSIAPPATARPTSLVLEPESPISPVPVNGVSVTVEEDEQKPIDIRFAGRGRSLSRATSRSRFGGTMTTAHTGMSVYYTPSSSVFDEYVSAPSSPIGSVATTARRQRSKISMSSSSDTITPSVIARPSSPPNNQNTDPPLERGPKLFLASAKSGESVPAIFEYIAKRVVLQWDWEERLLGRTIEYTERPNEVRAVELNATKADTPSYRACCS